MQSFGIRIYKEYFNFAAAHFLIIDDGTREELHGHNYQVQMALEGQLHPDKDLFIDFIHIKPLVKAVCDTLDHRTILPMDNRFLTVQATETQVEACFHDTDRWVFPRRDVVLLPIANTSVERLAQYLCQQTMQRLSQQYPDAMIRSVAFEAEESRGQAAIFRQTYNIPMPLVELVSTDEQAVLTGV